MVLAIVCCAVVQQGVVVEEVPRPRCQRRIEVGADALRRVVMQPSDGAEDEGDHDQAHPVAGEDAQEPEPQVPTERMIERALGDQVAADPEEPVDGDGADGRTRVDVLATEATDADRVGEDDREGQEHPHEIETVGAERIPVADRPSSDGDGLTSVGFAGAGRAFSEIAHRIMDCLECGLWDRHSRRRQISPDRSVPAPARPSVSTPTSAGRRGHGARRATSWRSRAGSWPRGRSAGTAPVRGRPHRPSASGC